jgi:hypothetical protein
MVEIDTQNKDDDAINAELFGNDQRIDYSLIPFSINHFKSNLENMIENAQTKEDFNAIGLKINYAIDHNLNIDYTAYQIKIAMKEAKIKEKQ